MSWEDEIKIFQIPKIYQNASLENAVMIKESIRDLGAKWLKAKTKPNLYLCGNPGCGKTYFAYSLFRGIGDNTPYVWKIFVRSDNLDAELLRSVLDGNEKFVLQKYLECTFLFIDDLGVEKTTERLLKQYYSIIDTRTSNEMTTVFSSNLPVSGIAANLGDRIASRLEMCYEIKFPEEDLRKRIQLPTI